MRAILVLAVMAVTACTAQDLGLAPASDDPMYLALAGKTLTLKDQPEVQVSLGADGTVSGFAQGRWRVTDGAYCRRLTAPPGMVGTECPVTELRGNEVTFISSTGTSVWTIGM